MGPLEWVYLDHRTTAKKRKNKLKKKGSAVLKKRHASRGQKSLTVEQLRGITAAANDPTLISIWRSIIKTFFPRMTVMQVASLTPSQLQLLAARLNVTLTSDHPAMSELNKAIEGMNDSDLGTTASGPTGSVLDGAAAAQGQQPSLQPVPQQQAVAPQPVQQQQAAVPQPVQLQPAVVPNAVLPAVDNRPLVEQLAAVVTAAVTAAVAPIQAQVTQLQATANQLSAELTANKLRQQQADRRLRDTTAELNQKTDTVNKKFKTMNARVKTFSKHLTAIAALHRRRSSSRGRHSGRTPSPPFSPVPSDNEEDSSDDPDAMSISRGGQVPANEPQGQAGMEQAGEQEQQQQPATAPVQQQVPQAMSPAPQAAPPPPPQQQQQQLPRQVSPVGNRGSGAGHASAEPDGQGPDQEVVVHILADVVEPVVHGPPPLVEMPPEEGMDRLEQRLGTELSPGMLSSMKPTRNLMIRAVKTINPDAARHLMGHERIMSPGGMGWLNEQLGPHPSSSRFKDTENGQSVSLAKKPRVKLPEPAKFHGMLDKHVTCTQTWFDAYVEYCKACGIDPVQNFIFYTMGVAQEWVTLYMREAAENGKALTVADLRTDFLSQYDDMHKHTAERARERLHAGEHHQQSGQSVNAYTQNFKLIVRDATHMLQMDKVQLYLTGLRATLRRACLRDATGKPRQALEPLNEYARGMEERDRMGRLATAEVVTVDKKPNLAYAFAPRPHKKRFGSEQHGNVPKRPKFGAGRQQPALQGKWQGGRPQNTSPQCGRQPDGWQTVGRHNGGRQHGGYQGNYRSDPGVGPSGTQPPPCRYCGDPFTRDHQRYCRNWPRRDGRDGK